MRVTTIDGGFRGRPNGARGHLRSLRGGLGAIATATQNTEASAFNTRFARFDQMDDLLRHSLTSGVLPLSDAMQLQAMFISMVAERNTHLARLSSLNNDADLVEWHSTADDIVTRAVALANHAGTLLGAEPEVRGWQIGVALVVGAGIFGAAAVWLSRLGKKRRR